MVQWLSHCTETKFNLSAFDIIFGVVNANDLDIIYVLNFCILFAKYFIYKQKSAEKEIDFYIFQIELKNRLEVEYIICTQQNCIEEFQQNWSLIIDNL